MGVLACCDPVSLGIDGGDPVREGGEVREGVALHAEGVHSGADGEVAAEPLDNRDQALRSVDRTAAHAADADHGAGEDQTVELVEAPQVVIRGAALQDRHESLSDAKVEGSGVAFPVGGDRPGDPVPDLLSIMGDLDFAAVIGAGHAPEGVRGGQRHVVVDGPGHAVVRDRHGVTGRIEIDAGQVGRARERACPPARPVAPAIGLAPPGQAVGRYQDRGLQCDGSGEERPSREMRQSDDDLDARRHDGRAAVGDRAHHKSSRNIMVSTRRVMLASAGSSEPHSRDWS